jgi:hypothetical protein
MSAEPNYDLMVLDLVNSMNRVRAAERELADAIRQRDMVLRSAEKLLEQFPARTRIDSSFLGEPPYQASQSQFPKLPGGKR